MPCPLLIFSQSDYLIQVVDTNSNTEWQTVQIQISWPTDLDLHYLQRQDISGFSRTRANICVCLSGYRSIKVDSKGRVGSFKFDLTTAPLPLPPPPPVNFTPFKNSAGWVANSVDPDQMLHSATSDLGLHCLFRPVCPNIWGYYGVLL